MDKKRWSVFLVIIFLSSFTIPLEALSDTNFLSAQIKVDSVSGDNLFKEIYASVYIGLAIYKMDVIEEHTKERLTSDLSTMPARPGIKFDIDNIDIGKKGRTRYYPFSIGDKNFIMRIFLTSEKVFQDHMPVLFEGSIANPAVTFQILPSLNEILAGCKISPHRSYSTRSIDSSP